jgi:hypothetical protein
MLRNSREFFDGRFWFSLTVIPDIGYLISSADKTKEGMLKEYMTKDDECALSVFDALIGTYHREGENALEKFKIKDRLSEDYYKFVTTKKE